MPADLHPDRSPDRSPDSLPDLRLDDATALVRAFAAGETDPAEVMLAALDRLDRLNPRLNAVIHPRHERALAEASDATQRWVRRVSESPVNHRAVSLLRSNFDGVPMAVKDLGCEQAGEPHHAGARFLAELSWQGTLDSHLYRLLRGAGSSKAGLISLGRTNTPEFGTTITTEPAVYGPTANPWDLTRSAGGSSGGSAAAVAAGIVPVAHGNDGGGSIRVPAAVCGLVGLKPTRGRVSPAPRLGEHRGGFAVDGMITRSVRDAALMLDVISVPAAGDPYVAPPLTPGATFWDAVGWGMAARVRIAVSCGNPGMAAKPVRRAVEATAALLDGLGHHVEPDTAPDGWFSPEAADHASVIRTVGMAAEMAGWAERLGRPMTADDIEPANWWSAELGKSLPASVYVTALGELARWRHRVMQFWAPSGFDLLLTPVLADVTPPLGYLSDPDEGAQRVASLARFVNQANLTGQPAIALPAALDDDALPIGVQLHALHGNESLLMAVAQQIIESGGLIPLPDLFPDAPSALLAGP